MRIIKTKDYKEMSRVAAKLLAAQIVMKPDCVLGLATGSSPIGTYEQLIEWTNIKDWIMKIIRATTILCMKTYSIM